MDDFLPFPSRDYFLMFFLLLVARGMDVLSTWVATPNLLLEGNPIAKKLGWRWGLPINLGVCLVLAFWPLPAIVISTTSVLVAARNFQSAWLMRSLGEQLYRDWHVERVQETNVSLYLFCLFAQTTLIAGVGNQYRSISVHHHAVRRLQFTIARTFMAKVHDVLASVGQFLNAIVASVSDIDVSVVITREAVWIFELAGERA